MGNAIVLSGAGADIEINDSASEIGWTRCFLINDKRIFLGADGLPYVLTGILKALQDQHQDMGQVVGEINGIAVRYAFHLEEAHHSLYYGDIENKRILFWQSDAHSPIELVGVIELSARQKAEWKESLTVVQKQMDLPMTV